MYNFETTQNEDYKKKNLPDHVHIIHYGVPQRKLHAGNQVENALKLGVIDPTFWMTHVCPKTHASGNSMAMEHASR